MYALKRFLRVRSPAQHFEDLRTATIAVLSRPLPKDLAEFIVRFLELSEFRVRLCAALKSASDGYGIDGSETSVGVFDVFYDRNWLSREPDESSLIYLTQPYRIPETSFHVVILSMERRGFVKLFQTWFLWTLPVSDDEDEETELAFGRKKDSYNQFSLVDKTYQLILTEPDLFDELFGKETMDDKDTENTEKDKEDKKDKKDNKGKEV